MVQMMDEAHGEEERRILAQAFHWRELLARGIDGCDRVSNMSPECLSEYEELPGPNMPLPCGYSVSALLCCCQDPVFDSESSCPSSEDRALRDQS